MLFCSSVFLVFFLCYLLLWYVTPFKWRLWLIIVASLIFYGYWNWNYVVIPVALTLVCDYGGKWISNTEQRKLRTSKLIFCVVIVFSPLIVFKYLNFFAQREIIPFGLPLGISYITFTLVAYLIDIARREYAVEKQFSWLLAYVIYFPQLIAGPILRPKELLPQLKQNLQASGLLRWQALTIFTVGLAKKVIFADQIKPFVDNIYAVTECISKVDGIVGCYLFCMQVYCDFSGYTDMAIGLALFFGIELPLNFNRPFFSASTTEVWRRWQMTLSFWFKDYLYIPIVKRYPQNYSKMLAKMLTMVLCGFWHGAGWTYITWGAFNGVLLCIEALFKGTVWSRLLPKTIKILLTFHLFALGVIFVRAYSFSQAIGMIKAIFSWEPLQLEGFAAYSYPLLLCVIAYILHGWDTIDTIKKFAKRVNPFLLGAVLTSTWLLAIALNVIGGGSSKFIYFDF